MRVFAQAKSFFKSFIFLLYSILCRIVKFFQKKGCKNLEKG